MKPSAMSHNSYQYRSRLLPILLFVMTPSLLAFNICRRHISADVCRAIRFRSVAPQLGVASFTGYERNTCYSYSNRPISTTSLLLSSSEAIEAQSRSPAVRSIRLPSNTSDEKLQLLSFYRFTPIADPQSIRDHLFEKLKTIRGLRGTVYVAGEGINAQFAVPCDSLQLLLNTFGKTGTSDGAVLPFDTFEKEPPNMGNVVDEGVPTFDRLIVRTRDYILRDGIAPDEENNSVLDWNDNGVELDAKDWDEQLRPLFSHADEKIQLLDCRNTYESDQGTFLESTALNTQTFSETWSLLDEKVQSNTLDPSKPTYIFCTGGIRCVKVGAYLKQRLGFEDVRSLKHGIIGYERWKSDDAEVNHKENNNSLWTGENFLFDKRRFAKEGDDVTGSTEQSQ